MNFFFKLNIFYTTTIKYMYNVYTVYMYIA